MAVQRAGFFRELRHGHQDGPSLAESRRDAAAPHEQDVIRYLTTGPILATTGTAVDDYLDPAKKKVAVLEIATDGSWIWPGDLAYYVTHYHVDLPADFVEQMRKNSWSPPRLSPQELADLDEELRTNPPR